jgi:hypothetical protein
MSRCTIFCWLALCRAAATCRITFSAGSFQRTAPVEHLAEIQALDVFLGDEMQPVDAADFVDLDDVGMHQSRRRLGLVDEPAHVRIVLCQRGLQHLDGDRPTQRLLFGQIDLGHPAAPQPAQQMIIAQLAARKIHGQPFARLDRSQLVRHRASDPFRSDAISSVVN